MVAKATSTGAKTWRDVSKIVNDKYRPYFAKQGDSEKRMTCCVSKYLHQVPLITTA